MFCPLYLRLLAFSVCGVGLTTPDAVCGWVCIKNETKAVLIVREVPARPSLKRGKTVKLLPGEVYREHQAAAGERRVQVYDAHDPAKPLCSAKLKWPAKDDVTYKLEVVEKTVRLSLVEPGKSSAQPAVPVGPAKPKR